MDEDIAQKTVKSGITFGSAFPMVISSHRKNEIYRWRIAK